MEAHTCNPTLERLRQQISTSSRKYWNAQWVSSRPVTVSCSDPVSKPRNPSWSVSPMKRYKQCLTTLVVVPTCNANTQKVQKESWTQGHLSYLAHLRSAETPRLSPKKNHPPHSLPSPNKAPNQETESQHSWQTTWYKLATIHSFDHPLTLLFK